MKILEKDLKKIIWESENKELRERGFPIAWGAKRLQDLKIGNYGTADMIFSDRVDGNLNISILVFKEGKIGISAFLEAIRLQKGINQFLNRRKGLQQKQVQIYLLLIGSEIDTSGSFCYLPDIYYNIGVYLYSLDINGLSFNRSNGHKLNNEGF